MLKSLCSISNAFCHTRICISVHSHSLRFCSQIRKPLAKPIDWIVDAIFCDLKEIGVPSMYHAKIINIFNNRLRDRMNQTAKINKIEDRISNLEIQMQHLQKAIECQSKLVHTISDIYVSTTITLIMRKLTKTLNYMGAIYFSFLGGKCVWNQKPDCMSYTTIFVLNFIILHICKPATYSNQV